MQRTRLEELSADLMRLSNVLQRDDSTNRVPDPSSFADVDQALVVDGTVLFADFGGSSLLVQDYDRDFAIWLLRAYLHCAALSIREFGGKISAFEGDGIMAIFTDKDKEERAVRCAFFIQWLVANAIQPAQATLYPSAAYRMSHVVGIDTSELHAVRTYVWKEYDILWVGDAANVAANLTRIRDTRFSTHITDRVHEKIDHQAMQLRDSSLWSKIYRTDAGSQILSAGVGLGA